MRVILKKTQEALIVILFTSLFLFEFPTIAIAQDVSCEDLVDFLESKAFLKGSISNYQLNSSWLENVKAYEYDGEIYVIAEIKRNYSSKKYVFCGIPQQNWSSFQGIYSSQGSYGERFHKYIMDYVCDCD